MVPICMMSLFMVTYNSDTRLTNTINTITITSVNFEKSTLNKTSTQHLKGKSSAHCQDRIPSLCLERYRDIAATESNVLFLSHKTTFKLHGILLMKQLRHQM